jgi:hypothetical protein
VAEGNLSPYYHHLAEGNSMSLLKRSLRAMPDMAKQLKDQGVPLTKDFAQLFFTNLATNGGQVWSAVTQALGQTGVAHFGDARLRVYDMEARLEEARQKLADLTATADEKEHKKEKKALKAEIERLNHKLEKAEKNQKVKKIEREEEIADKVHGPNIDIASANKKAELNAASDKSLSEAQERIQKMETSRLEYEKKNEELHRDIAKIKFDRIMKKAQDKRAFVLEDIAFMGAQMDKFRKEIAMDAAKASKAELYDMMIQKTHEEHQQLVLKADKTEGGQN